MQAFQKRKERLFFMQVKDCMCGGEVVQATPDTNVCEIAKLMNENHVGCVPICKEEKVVGFVTDRDIVLRAIACQKDCNSTKVSDIMNTNIIKTTPDSEIGAAIEVMQKNQIRRLPVIENNKIVGILSMSDLAVSIDSEEVGHTLECICEDNNCNCD
jgi:CBS domain-containing protein